MKYQLFIRPLFTLTSDGPQSDQYEWAVYSPDNQLTGYGSDHRQDIEEWLTDQDIPAFSVIGLLPTIDVTYCSARIPGRVNQATLNQALPYAVEDQLAQSVETLHIAHGARQADVYPVAVIDRYRMGEWIEVMGDWENGEIEALIPDASLLPVTESGWSAVITNDQIIARYQDQLWLSLPTSELSIFAMTLQSTQGNDSNAASAKIPLRYWCIPPDAEHTLTQTEFPEFIAPEGDPEAPTSLTTWLAENYQKHRGAPINLCQKAFSVSSANRSKWRIWRPLGIAAALWLAVEAGINMGMGIHHHQAAERINAETMAIYHQFFPEDTRSGPDNLQRVIKGQLRVAGPQTSNTSFIDLMRVTGEAHKQALKSGSDLTLRSISYNEQRGELIVDLRGGGYRQLAQFRDEVASRGLDADIGSVINNPEGTDGRLTVKGEL